jgi:hypothetical protein
MKKEQRSKRRPYDAGYKNYGVLPEDDSWTSKQVTVKWKSIETVNSKFIWW